MSNVTGLQREEVDAALRAGAGAGSEVDQTGLALATEAAEALCEHLTERVLEWRVWRDEVTITVDTGAIVDAAQYLRDKQGFALLSDISPCDRLGSEHEHPARFNVDYVATKITTGAPRIRLRIWVDEDETIESLIGVWPTADWHEREAFDFYGIEFTGREQMRKLIMPEDWVGHPLRKDYPMGGEPVQFTDSPRELD